MSDSDSVQLPTQCLRDLARWIRQTKLAGAVVGGVAATLLGSPRMTRDVDVLVSDAAGSWVQLLQSAHEFGFGPRGTRREVLQFAREVHVLLLQHGRSGTEVDIMSGEMQFEQEAIGRCRPVRIGRFNLPVVTPEDLIILKAIAGRSRDLADIVGILQIQKDLDVSRVRATVREFSLQLDSPAMLDNLERLLQGAPRRRRKS